MKVNNWDLSKKDYHHHHGSTKCGICFIIPPHIYEKIIIKGDEKRRERALYHFTYVLKLSLVNSSSY